MTGGRRTSVLTALVLGAAILVVSTTVWVRSVTSSAVDESVPIEVTGAAMAPAVTAGGLVVLAAAGALALGGRWGRPMASAGVVLGGLLTAGAAATAARRAREAALLHAQTTVGVGDLQGPVAVTAMPWLAVALGLVVALLGARAAVVSRHWGGPSSRHDGPGAGATPRPTDHAVGEEPAVDGGDEQATWDALTRGDDPT